MKLEKKGTRFCPQCRSEDVVLEGKLIETGSSWLCKSCGYGSYNFPIKVKIIKNKLKKLKGD